MPPQLTLQQLLVTLDVRCIERCELSKVLLLLVGLVSCHVRDVVVLSPDLTGTSQLYALGERLLGFHSDLLGFLGFCLHLNILQFLLFQGRKND